MLLFDTLHMASSSMSAAQLGMQVAGQNLANADVPGYVRELMVTETATTRKLGNGVIIGTGVNVAGVVQVLDQYLEERLRGATSDAVGTATEQKYFTELEALLNELTGYDLSTAIDDFFNSIDEVVNHPENVSYRQMSAGEGERLAGIINAMAQSIIEMQIGVNSSVTKAADEINRLVTEIDELNKNIALLESGRGPSTQAIGLRDQRLRALGELSTYINIKTYEDDATGAVSIYCGSDALLAAGTLSEVYVNARDTTVNGVVKLDLYVKPSGAKLDVRSGSVHGMYQGRDVVLGEYAQKLDDFTYNFVKEFNAVYSSGQGLTGYTDVASLAALPDASRPLSESGLPFEIVNGGFVIQTYSAGNTTPVPHTIWVNVEAPPEIDPYSLNPQPVGTGTTLQDIVDQINAIEGLAANVTNHGELRIRTDNDNMTFAFADDSSGVLSALGINTFFTGSTAATVGINGTVLKDPTKFAVSTDGVGHDVNNGVQLAAMVTAPNPNLGNRSIPEVYRGIVSETMLAAASVKSMAATNSLYLQTLQAQRDAISGVNVDEETIQMMTWQRMYQANAKLVSLIDEMLRTLVNL